MAITLVLGGARSGKSRHAEELAIATQKTLIYIATAQFSDEEMRERIDIHQSTRGNNWTTIEAPIDIVATLKENQGNTILIDCLTLWINNLLFHFPHASIEDRVTDLLAALKNYQGNIFLVSNEVGLGIIPIGEVSRRFVDESGRMNQRIAAIADKVIFMVSGIPMQIKQKP